MTRPAFALLLLATVLAAGCQFPYSWETSAPEVQDAVKGISCGETLTGTVDWYYLDYDDYFDGTWNEVCSIRFDLEGTLTTDYNSAQCYACRCVYDIVATVAADSCDEYDVGDTIDDQFGFTPTAQGPEEFLDKASDWPWLVYTGFSPAWDELKVQFYAREDQEALPGSFDANELYLTSRYYWPNEAAGTALVLRGWVGLGD